jgi:hypothetical protein
MAKRALPTVHESDTFTGEVVRSAQIVEHLLKQVVWNSECDHLNACKWAMSVSIGRSPPGTRQEYANQFRSRILMFCPFQLRPSRELTVWEKNSRLS